MKRAKFLLVVLLVLSISIIAYATLSFAEDKGKDEDVSGKAMEKPMEMLKYKNIMGDLGADYHYLADIGEMIDIGREHKDGNTLFRKYRGMDSFA